MLNEPMFVLPEKSVMARVDSTQVVLQPFSRAGEFRH